MYSIEHIANLSIHIVENWKLKLCANSVYDRYSKIDDIVLTNKETLIYNEDFYWFFFLNFVGFRLPWDNRVEVHLPPPPIGRQGSRVHLVNMYSEIQETCDLFDLFRRLSDRVNRLNTQCCPSFKRENES